MIPLTATIRVHTDRVRLHLWIPLFLAWLILLPLVLLLLPLAFVACLVVELNPFQVFATFWGLISGLKGTHVEVEDPQAHVLVDIS